MRSSYRQPSLGEGVVSGIAVDRVLSQTAYLRRSFPLSFIPLEPYPARSARHLPHAGKALSVIILFPHMHVFALTMREKRYSRFVSLPHWGRGTASAVDRVLSYIVDLRRISPLSFMPLEPYPARSARHLPHAGKALSVDIVFSTYAYIRSDDMGIAVLSYNGALETISPRSFSYRFPHPTSAPSGHLLP